MANITCFYSQPTCVPKLTREHVVSASALRHAFGASIRNVARAELWGDKLLIDHEAVLKDVCAYCNNAALSTYDTAGVELLEQLSSNDPAGLTINVSRETIGWILKTHFNHIRLIKDRKLNESYPIDSRLKAALIKHASIPDNLFKFYIEGWQAEPYFWDADDPRRIPWFDYRSLRYKRQRIAISDFRMKTLTTWLLIPSDGDYVDFEQRASSTLEEVYQEYGFRLQCINTATAIERGQMTLERVVPSTEVQRFIRYHTL